MEQIDVSDMDRPRDRWVQFGELGFLVRYASPQETDRFRAKLTRNGIARHDRESGFQINIGRERDFYKAIAEQYVLDWRGNILIAGKTEPYSVENMAKILGGHGGVLAAIQRAIQDDDAFFGNGGNGSTPT